MVIIGLIVVVVLIIAWVVGIVNQLNVLDERVNNALSQIDVNLTSRFDALTGLLDLVKGYNEHEYKTLSDTVAMRRTGHTAADIQNNEDIFANALGRIVATAENYPDLKANQNYQNIMNSLNDYENKVRNTRLVANDSITKLNEKIRQVPYNFIAPIAGVSKREYLKIEERKQEMPSMK